MRTSVREVVIIGTVLAATLAQSQARGKDAETPAERIIGMWSSLIRLPDGKGYTLVFKTDGTFEQLLDFQTVGRWETKGKQLVVHTWDRERSRDKKQAFEMDLQANSLVLKEAAGGGEIRMARTHEADSIRDGLMGEWYSENYPGGVPVVPLGLPLRTPAFVEFGREHRLSFRSNPVAIRRGRYEFVGKELVIMREGEPPLRCKPRFPDDQLRMPITARGPEFAFKHVVTSENAPIGTGPSKP